MTVSWNSRQFRAVASAGEAPAGAISLGGIATGTAWCTTQPLQVSMIPPMTIPRCLITILTT
jgi:hypothetical protein